MPLNDISSAADVVAAIIGGWRFLFSRRYRMEKQQEWREQGWLSVLFDVVFGLFGILLSLGLLAFAASFGWP